MNINIDPICTEIDRIETWNSGGGCYIDLITLKNGKVLSITDECLIVRNNVEEVYENTPTEDYNVVFFALHNQPIDVEEKDYTQEEAIKILRKLFPNKYCAVNLEYNQYEHITEPCIYHKAYVADVGHSEECQSYREAVQSIIDKHVANALKEE